MVEIQSKINKVNILALLLYSWAAQCTQCFRRCIKFFMPVTCVPQMYSEGSEFLPQNNETALQYFKKASDLVRMRL